MTTAWTRHTVLDIVAAVAVGELLGAQPGAGATPGPRVLLELAHDALSRALLPLSPAAQADAREAAVQFCKALRAGKTPSAELVHRLQVLG